MAMWASWPMCTFKIFTRPLLWMSNAQNCTQYLRYKLLYMLQVKFDFRLSFFNLQSSSKVLGRLPFLPLLFLPSPAPGPMLIKTLIFVRVIFLLYPNIEQGGRGYLAKEKTLFFQD